MFTAKGASSDTGHLQANDTQEQSKYSVGSTVKAKQINIRLTAEQQRLFKQHCNRTGMNTQAAVTDALRRVIDGF